MGWREPQPGDAVGGNIPDFVVELSGNPNDKTNGTAE
jgi:hypothetical protein